MGKIAESVSCLPPKQGQQSSVPSSHGKNSMLGAHCTFATQALGKVRQEVLWSSLARKHSQTESSRLSERLSQKIRWGRTVKDVKQVMVERVLYS